MGKRGPKPTPTPILKVRGSWRGKVRTDEPKPERTRPACPSWLRKEAKRAWREVVPQIEAMGVLGKCDRNALARYCQTWAKWRAAEEVLIEQGDTREVKAVTDAGDIVVLDVKDRPEVARSMKLADQLLRLEQQFGLTPSARVSLAAPKHKPEEHQGKDRFFTPRAG